MRILRDSTGSVILSPATGSDEIALLAIIDTITRGGTIRIEANGRDVAVNWNVAATPWEGDTETLRHDMATLDDINRG